MATAAKPKATKQRSIERSSAKPKGSADLIRQHRAILKGARFEEILDYYYTGLKLELYDG